MRALAAAVCICACTTCKTDAGPCLPGMVAIDGYCIDRYEASVVEVDDAGVERPHDPLYPVDGLTVRAVVLAGVRPQGYISQVQADEACALAGKRLCTSAELSRACRGPDAGSTYPYGGTTRVPGACNEGKGSALPMFFGTDPSQWTYADLNDPRLNAWDGGLAPTGEYARCVSPDGVYDCVGNLNEWGSDGFDGRGLLHFRGGYFGDAELGGHGCDHISGAFEPTFHDYTSGFRCCADAGVR